MGSADPDIERALAQLDVAIEFCRKLGDSVAITIRLPETETEKAAWLEATGRPFFEVTPELQQAISDAMQRRITEVFDSGEGTAAVAEIFSVGAEAARAHVLDRFKNEGGDISLILDSPGWVRTKSRRGLSLLTGIYTGALVRSVASSPIDFT